MRLLIALVVWIGAAAGAAGLSTVVADSIHNPPGSSTSSGGGSGFGGSGGSSFDASAVTATDPVSLFRTPNFARALAAARSNLGSGAQVEELALYPGYASVIAAKGGMQVDFYINAAGTTNVSSGGSPGGLPLLSLARVNANVPAALARRIATAGHVPESQLHYMVAQIDPVDHQFRWLVYTVQGSSVEYFQAAGATGPLLEYRQNSSTGLQPVRG
jgi:hypothetical protein